MKDLLQEPQLQAGDAKDLLDEMDEHPVIADAVEPNEQQKKLIDEVLAVGQEFKAIHKKLTELMDNGLRTKVTTLKNEVFKVRKGSAGIAITVGSLPSDTPSCWLRYGMRWSEFCQYAFGVTARRINQLLDIDDLRDTAKIRETVARISLTKEAFKAEIDKAYASGRHSIAQETLDRVNAAEDQYDESDESTVAHLEKVLSEANATSKWVETVTNCSNHYTYFERFKDEPETLASELAAMLLEFGLDSEEVKRVLKLTEKSVLVNK